MAVKYTKAILEQAVSRAYSLAGVLRALGFESYSGGTSSHLRSRIELYGIDTSHFLGPHSAKGKRAHNRRNLEQVLVSGKTKRTETHVLRRCLLEFGTLSQCAVCGNPSTWQGKSLTLQIDHSNGDWSDDRVENLRFLCPNCHSQQPTSIRQKQQPTTRPCAALCGVRFKVLKLSSSKKFCSLSCRSSSQRGKLKAVWPDNETLKKLLWERPATLVAKELGVSSVAVKKWCKRRGIETPPRGYWAKIESNGKTTS